MFVCFHVLQFFLKIQNKNSYPIFLFLYIFGTIPAQNKKHEPFRLGPSASQVMPDDDKLNQFVSAVSLLQSMMNQPWAQGIMHKLGGVAAIDPAVKSAQDGAPSSSRPGIMAASTPVPTTVETKVEGKDASKETPKVSEKGGGEKAVKPPEPPTKPVKKQEFHDQPPTPSTPPSVPDTINSSTFRNAHARLTRRMGNLAEGECPNMIRLWQGTRKD